MDTNSAKRILITGATGLVGSYIARTLVADASNQVVATKRPSSPLELLGDATQHIQWREGDLEDPDFIDSIVEGVDILVHCAGLVSYKKEDAKALYVQNVQVTHDILNAAIRCEVQQFVHISSISAISPSTSSDTIHEGFLTFHPNQHTTRYAKSKFDAELQVWRAAEEGLPITILNPSVVLAAGYWDRSSCRLFEWVNAGQRFYPPGATGYVDARDIAAFAKTCIDKQLTGKRYLLNAENWTYKAFFDEVASNLNVSPPSVKVSAWQAELAWRIEALKAGITGKSALLTKETARRSMTANSFDNTLSLDAGATYRPVAETIREIAQVYQKTKAKGWGLLPLD